MKKSISIALALISAQAAADAQPAMEHVLVTLPVHKKVAETALPVTVLTGEELRRRASATIGETLSNSPGLANASFGPGVGQPVIRGQAGPRVTVLQNGTTSADASNISADHAVSVEPLLAQSVEVLRGPATLLYGGGAIGGVVNVLDNRIPVRAIDGLSGAGEVRYDDASSGEVAVGRLEGGNGRFAFHLDGLYRDWDDFEIPGMAIREDDHEDEHEDDHEGEDHDEDMSREGVIENSGGRTKSLGLGGAWHFESGFLGLSFSRLENNYGIPPGGHSHEDEHGEEHEDDHDDDHEDGHDEDHNEEHDHGEEEELIRLDVEQTRYDMALHLHDPLPGLDVFRGFLSYTDYEHVELEGAEVGTRYTSETWETRLEAVHSPWGQFHGSFGLQARATEFSAVGEESFIPLTDSTDIGVFLVEDYHRGPWTLEGGLRADWVERDPQGIAARKRDFSTLSISGSAQYDMTDQWQLGLSLMHAERAPAIEELYSNAGNDRPQDWVVHAATRSIELGDQDLDTETSNNVDLTLSWYRDDQFLTVTAFYNDFADYIALLDTGFGVDEIPVLAYENDDATFHGVEFDSEFTLGESGGGTIRLGLSGDVIRGELDNGADVPRLPPRRLWARLSWESDAWMVYARVLDAAKQDRPGPNEAETQAYTRWDAGAEYRRSLSERGDLVLFFNLKNITDEEIRLSTSFLRDFSPDPGFSLEAGVRLMM